MRKVGIFGGSFNPIHTGHIALARALQKECGLDEVWLMVSPMNPLKWNDSDLLEDNLRFEMAQKALEDVEGVKACDYEFHLPKPSYTWNTLQHLKEDFPDYTFVLLIGGDNWKLFHRWYRAEDIVKEYEMVIYPRRDSDIDRTTLPSNVTIVDTDLLDISSTIVRERIRKGEPINGMVPPAIEQLALKYYSL
jgi:nicotinate-nucleotide adenylyltransferase